MSSWGIRARVLVLALLPSVLILLTLVSYFTYERITEVDASLAQRGRLVARQLAPSAEFALFSGDHSTLQRLTDAAVRETDVVWASVTDVHGQDLAYSTAPDTGDVADTARFAEAVKRTRLAATDFPEPSSTGAATDVIGTITVAMSRSGVKSQQRRLLLIGLAIGIVGLLVAIALAHAIGRSIIEPTRQLARAMTELSWNRDIAPLPSDGGGEFQTLSEGFNTMAARLRASTLELESQISDATRDAVAQRNAAEQATQAKSRFIAAASHDLRQPLHAIQLFAAALQRRARTTELETLVADLVKSVAMMESLFDSLLDISRLDAGTLQSDPKPFALCHLFAQIEAEFADGAAQKRVRLRIVPTGTIVYSDELLLRRILTNLVANAVRYTNAGSVMVCARQRGDTVDIEVRDSGIGIPPEKQRDIFQEFYQISYVSRERNTGLGLGLAIVARLSKLIGSDVHVRSAVGKGSVFSLRVPRSHATPARPSSPAEPVTPVAPIERWPMLHVLVIDDDPLVLSGSRALLETLGCVVTTVPDGEAARRALAELIGRRVLVMCDVWLGSGENGIELLQHLSERHAPSISAFLISGDVRPETVESALRAGFIILHKPVAPAKLREVVEQFARGANPIFTVGQRDENSSS